MEHNRIGSESQGNIHVSSKIHDFFDHFRIGTLLHQCGVRKRHGYSVRSLIVAIFALPFLGKDFFRGIVTNEQAIVGKDAAYDLLKGCTYNWRRLLLMLAVRIRPRPQKTDWLALLSTDIHLSDEDVVRIYGKRCDIEVLFKMAKQHLKLAKEIQCRDFDALIAHTTLVFIRYQFIAYCIRMESDHRSFGDLFYACCDELSDISFVEALHRLLTLAVEQLREMGTVCEKTAAAFFDMVMQAALQYFNLPVCSMAMSET